MTTLSLRPDALQISRSRSEASSAQTTKSGAQPAPAPAVQIDGTLIGLMFGLVLWVIVASVSLGAIAGGLSSVVKASSNTASARR